MDHRYGSFRTARLIAIWLLAPLGCICIIARFAPPAAAAPAVADPAAAPPIAEPITAASTVAELVGSVTVMMFLWILVILVVSAVVIYIAKLIRNGPRTGRISKAPGTRLLLIVDFLFSPATVEETFKPTVADWRKEYFEALRQKRFLKAGWISVRYRYRFILAMGLSKVFSVIKSFKSVIK